MERHNIYLYLSDEDPSVFPHESAADFTVSLPKTLHILPGEWEMALQSVSYMGDIISSPIPKMISFCCDVVDSSIIHGSEAQVLRRLVNTGVNKVDWTFNELQYIPVVRGDLTSVRLYLLTEKGVPVEFNSISYIFYTLHLKRINTLL